MQAFRNQSGVRRWAVAPRGADPAWSPLGFGLAAFMIDGTALAQTANQSGAQLAEDAGSGGHRGSASTEVQSAEVTGHRSTFAAVERFVLEGGAGRRSGRVASWKAAAARFPARGGVSAIAGLARLLVPAVAVLALSACRPSSHIGAAARTSGEEVTRYPATDYYQQAPGKPGGVLKITAARDAGSLDFHSISDSNAQWLGRLIYDNLVYLDDQGRITPWLATSWEISPDGKSYTFHLRHDVTFSDGTKFDAEAVRINLEHMRDPATKSPLAAAYIAPYLDGKALDPYTFQARLREPYAPFLNVLAQSWLSMESPKAILERPKQIGQAPVGSGPFVVAGYTRQQEIRLLRRPDYHWSPPFVRHQGPAYLNEIDIDVVPEALTRYSSLASGQYDLTLDAPLQNAKAIEADNRLVFDRRMRTGIPFRGVTFNTSRPPFTDVRVRRAFALAVDRQGIVQAVGFGELSAKTDFLAANTRYYDPSFRNLLNYDPAEANRLLDQAGWTGRDAQGFRTKNGVRLGAEVLALDSPTSTPSLVAIQSDVRKVGFNLKITPLPTPQLTDRRNAGDYQALGAGVWHTNTPDALYIVFDSAEITSSKRIGQNTARLSDPELDDLLARARRTNDPAELQSLYSKAQGRLVELVPAVPLYENDTVIAYSRALHGLIFDTSHNTPVFTAAWLDRGGQ